MKNMKTQWLFSMIIAMNVIFGTSAQISLSYPTRTQLLNQYTSVFICSPNNGTIIQNIHNDDLMANSDKFQYYDNGWVYLAEETPTTTMIPGKGYVLQLGGNGTYTDDDLDDREFDFTGGSANDGPISVATGGAGQFNLLGNPYNNFLDLDAFLLNTTNRNLLRGPVYLWSHNTIISNDNVNPNDPNYYRNSANDFALYNVLGGVASGRQINNSPENGTYTGIQTPNGKLCFGTGFGIYSTGSGNIVYNNGMRTSDITIEAQSFRGVASNDSSNGKSEQTSPNPNSTPNTVALTGKNRIWVNIEEGEIPTVGLNTNQLKQLLVGYIDGATAGDNDPLYDAETVTVQSKIEFYSLAAGSTKHLAIQGRDNSEFLGTDFFQLGYEVSQSGRYTFTANGDGAFDPAGGKPYFLWDNGTLHEFPYTVDILSGDLINNTRFRIVFGQKSLALKVNIEGYYDNSLNLMRPVALNQGTSINPMIVDENILVQLRDPLNLSTVHTENTILATNGNININFPNLAVGSYYVAIKHRNAIWTWSATPIQLVSTLLYDFTTAASKAYGNNQIEVEPGVYAFYSGDINQDESIDNSDGDLLYSDIENSNFGDLPTDLNGDGGVDNSDTDFYFNNINNFIFSMHP